MDRLDQVLPTAGPLLRRVDEMISTAGAPADHRLWAELRRVRILPSDAVHAVAALRPAELLEAAPELRADARAYAELAGSLPTPKSWTGEAAEAYNEALRRTADHLTGGNESLDERLEATADLADALFDWMSQARGELASVLAEVLTSTEALAMADEDGSDPTADRAVTAAAEVGARVLQSIAETYERAEDLLKGSAGLVNPVPAVT